MGILWNLISAINEERDEARKREIASRLVESARGRIQDDLVSDYFERRLQERHPEWDKGSGN